MKRSLLILLLSLPPVFLFAQGREAKLPLMRVPAAQQTGTEPVNAARALGKASSGLYPFVDFFADAGTRVNDSLWLPSQASRPARYVVFNGLDSTGAAHSGVSGASDILQSQLIDLYQVQGQAYLHFTYSTGSSWTPADSLTLELKSGGGNYIRMWTSPASLETEREVFILITPLGDYLSPQFDIRFTNYGAHNLLKNEDFRLHQVTLMHKWAVPFYENFFNYDSIRSIPSAVHWQQRPVKPTQLIQTGFGISNQVVMDARDAGGAVYHGANGAYGGADTLTSALIDLTTFALGDSVYLRFFYQALGNAASTDSLALEYRNNGGLWVRVWQTGGQQTTGFNAFINQVNFGKFRSPLFQFRLIVQCHYLEADTMKFAIAGVHIGRKSNLPFIDDFSTSGLYPSSKLWTTRHTYISNGFPVKPPSYNVAVFDGLDVNGNFYKPGFKYADTLTSVSLNLSKLSATDTGVYLTFYLEPTGLGEKPNANDSIILEFRHGATSPNDFTMVWATLRNNLDQTAFTQFVVKVDPKYFHDDFQFRFKNTGGTFGNLNHWLIDYIRMDKSGLAAATSYYDIALGKTESSLLTPYHSMPYDHFAVNPAAYLKGTQQLTIRNNEVIPKPAGYSREIFDPSGTRIDSVGNNIGSVIKDTTVSLTKTVSLTWTPTSDSTVFTARYQASTLVNSDNIPFNDTLSNKTIFSNFYAYDDGSAENGYAIQNTTGSVALGYTLPKADKLYGISMFFNQSVSDVSQRVFDLMLWKRINTNGNGTGEELIARFPLISPVYKNTINGFYYYKLGTPIDLPAGKFYIGWDQTQLFDLNIGIDENYEVNGSRINPEMHYFLDDQGVWAQTSETGALMMRPIVGKWIEPPVGLPTLTHPMELAVTIYPNPAKDRIYLSGNQDGYQVELFDVMGRVIVKPQQVTRELAIPAVNEGVYLLQIIAPDGRRAVKRVLIGN